MCIYPHHPRSSVLGPRSVLQFVEDGHSIVLAQSFAKNFGLYGQRVGVISFVSVLCPKSGVACIQRLLGVGGPTQVTSEASTASAVTSQLKAIVRPMYSSPPVDGARIVKEILMDTDLKAQWTRDCATMAARITSMRSALTSCLENAGSARTFLVQRISQSRACIIRFRLLLR